MLTPKYMVHPEPHVWPRNRTVLVLDVLLRPLTTLVAFTVRFESSIPDEVLLDAEYLRRRSLSFDLRILALTVLRVVRSEGVLH